MSLVSTQQLGSIEQRRSTLFLGAGVLFGINVAIVAAVIATGADEAALLLGESFNAAAWAIALVGLLGLYPGVADRRTWLARVGGVCAAIGMVVFTALSVLSFVFYVDLLQGGIESLVPLILPGVIIGGVLSFVLFGVAGLRTDVYPRSIGILLLLPPLIVIANIVIGAAGVESSVSLLGVVSGLFVVMLVIGFRLRSSSERPDRGEVTPGGTTK